MKNPAEFAQPLAQKMMLEGYFTGTDDDSFDIDQERFLTHVADYLGLLERPYDVHVNKALILPLDANGNVSQQFDELRFTGELTEYSAVNSPRMLGRKAINALCLTFQNVTLLPYDERLSDVALYVPAHSAYQIEQIAS